MTDGLRILVSPPPPRALSMAALWLAGQRMDDEPRLVVLSTFGYVMASVTPDCPPHCSFARSVDPTSPEPLPHRPSPIRPPSRSLPSMPIAREQAGNPVGTPFGRQLQLQQLNINPAFLLSKTFLGNWMSVR